MRKRTNWVAISLVILVLSIGLIIYLYATNNSQNSNKEIQTKILTLSKDNFVILDKNYFMELSTETCNKGKIKDCSWAGTTPCDNMVYSTTFKLVNFPKEIDVSSSTEIGSNLQIKAYSNGQEVGYKDTDGILQKISFTMNDLTTPVVMIPLKYTQENNLVFCFQINGSEFYHNNYPTDYKYSNIVSITSNEVCLDSIKISAFC